MTTPIRATYNQDPLALKLNLSALKPGHYIIEGEATQASWQAAAVRINIPPEGGCHVRLDLTLSKNHLVVQGIITTTLALTCMRTLEPFTHEQAIPVEERIFRAGHNADDHEQEEDVQLEDDIFDVGDFVIQNIILGLPSHPLHPRLVGSERGSYNLLDPNDTDDEEEKNPFSVLKHLKA